MCNALMETMEPKLEEVRKEERGGGSGGYTNTDLGVLMEIAQVYKPNRKFWAGKSGTLRFFQ